MDKENLKSSFIHALLKYDLNVEFANHYYSVAIFYSESPTPQVPDFGAYALSLLFWLVVASGSAVGIFAMRRYLEEVATRIMEV